MVAPLLRLSVALQAVVERVQQLGDRRVADRMVLPPQFGGNRPGALADPPQGGLRIATGLSIDHRFQGLHEPRVGHRQRFPPTAGASDAAFPQYGAFLDLPDTFADRFPRQPAGLTDETHAAIAQRLGFAGRHNTSQAFV